MSVAGRRSRDQAGIDNARRDEGLDVRWGDAYAAIVVPHPELKVDVWDLCSETFDMGARSKPGPPGRPNPFWRDPPDVAGDPSAPPPQQPRSLLMLPKIAPYAKALVGFVSPGIVGLVAAVQDASPGGSAVTVPEWVGILAACVLTGGAVFAVPNKDPRAEHQAESTQPPGR